MTDIKSVICCLHYPVSNDISSLGGGVYLLFYEIYIGNTKCLTVLKKFRINDHFSNQLCVSTGGHFQPYFNISLQDFQNFLHYFLTGFILYHDIMMCMS